MKNVKEKAKKVAGSKSALLITGETGVGKEVLARAIHEHGRNTAPFVTVNCAAIPGELLESELFGYEGGAFTGARRSGKQGKFELADKGTLFLDEIGDMPLHLQSKLLNVLRSDGQVITRVGGTEEINIQARIISATNKDLTDLVRQNRFREDLFYRLSVIPLCIPPLRRRLEDVIKLTKFFIAKYSKKIGKNIFDIEPEVFRIFKKYSWPGNLRELENTIEYAINMCESPVLSAKYLPDYLTSSLEQSPVQKSLEKQVRSFEKSIITEALSKYGNSVEGKQAAAEELEISIATLYRKLNNVSTA